MRKDINPLITKNLLICVVVLIFVIIELSTSNFEELYLCPEACQCDKIFEDYYRRMNCSGNSSKVIPRTSDDVAIEDLVLLSYFLTTLNDTTFMHYRNIKSLHLRHCSIENIEPKSFEMLIDITVIDLSFNNIGYIDPKTFENLKNLETLDLQGNNLEYISDSFITSTSIKALNLRRCNLEYISPYSFQSLPQLGVLNLRENKLKILHENTFLTLNNIHSVDLRKNPWMCDCALQELLNKLWIENVLYEVSGSSISCDDSNSFFCYETGNKKLLWSSCFDNLECENINANFIFRSFVNLPKTLNSPDEQEKSINSDITSILKPSLGRYENKDKETTKASISFNGTNVTSSIKQHINFERDEKDSEIVNVEPQMNGDKLAITETTEKVTESSTPFIKATTERQLSVISSTKSINFEFTKIDILVICAVCILGMLFVLLKNSHSIKQSQSETISLLFMRKKQTDDEAPA